MNKFKVGDRVKILSKSLYGDLSSSAVFYHGGPFYVTRINGDGSGRDSDNCITVNFDKDNTGDYFAPEDLELVKEELKDERIILQFCAYNASLLVETNEQMNIIKQIKDLTLSSEDRILRKNGFEDENGKMMETAKTMMTDEIIEREWKERRKDVAEKLKELDKDK